MVKLPVDGETVVLVGWSAMVDKSFREPSVDELVAAEELTVGENNFRQLRMLEVSFADPRTKLYPAGGVRVTLSAVVS